MNIDNKQDALTLELLEVIDKRSDVTQRHLADRLGVALGMTNSYLKRCVRKGMVKIHQAPANRYLYYLTPHGFAEKSRLTANYLSYSFDFYRRSSESCTNVFKKCHEHEWERALLCGISELGEIASLRAKEQNIEIVGFFDQDSNVKKFLDLPVWITMDLLPDFDVCVITDVKHPGALIEYLHYYVAKELILAPDILGVDTESSPELPATE